MSADGQQGEETLDALPRDGVGFRLRGVGMTRIETFVDAAFAFAVTMLVISVDSIPSDFPAMIEALKGVPAFATSLAVIMMVWFDHHKWSRRYGLDDATTVALSVALVFVVLVYIYPLRVMFSGMFHWFSNGWLASDFALGSLENLRSLFIIYSVGFMAIAAVITGLYRHAISRADALRLDDRERFVTRTEFLAALILFSVAMAAALLAALLPDSIVMFSPFIYALLGVLLPLHHHLAWKRFEEETPA